MKSKPAGQTPYVLSFDSRGVRLEEIYTIFEGTSEIQRLVIARAISGMRIR
jgi:alkylation response protein AidB-like acyl-CoA dehydrogenase